MRVLVDENIPSPTVDALREMGHDVKDVRGTPAEGFSDEALWALAQAEGRLLVSTDKSFGRRREGVHFGVLVVRLRQPNWRRIHERVLEAMACVDEPDWEGLVLTMRDTVMSRRRGERRAR
jgi:predicted nuclease of predicted toxin-antitoxin system